MVLYRNSSLCELNNKYALTIYGAENILFLRINSKIVKSFFLNIVTTLGLLYSLNLIYDIRNYIAIFFIFLFGMFNLSVIGYFIAMLGIVFCLKREMVSFIHIILVVICLQIKNVNFLFPFTVIRSEINGLIISDIILSEVYNGKVSILVYLIASILITLVLSYCFLVMLGIINRNKKIKGVYSKNESNSI